MSGYLSIGEALAFDTFEDQVSAGRASGSRRTLPPPEPLPPGTYPIVAPDLSTYGVIQPMARQLGVTQVGPLQDRVGSTLNPASLGTGVGQSIWLHFFGQQVDNRYKAFSDPRANGELFGFQAGLDLWRGNLFPGQLDVVGVYFAYGYTHANVSESELSFAADTTKVPLSDEARLEFAGGVNYTLARSWSFFAQAGYQFAVAPSSIRRNGAEGDVHLHFTW